MASTGLQILGVSLAVIGWIGSIVCCVLPIWKVNAHTEGSIVTAQNTWDGLWMSCVVQSTGQMQCKINDSVLATPKDIQVARALLIIVIILGILGILTALVGGKCTNCLQDADVKAKICIASGIIFLISGILLLIPVSWTASNIVSDFHDAQVSKSNKKELGASLYIGWTGAVLLLIGGALLCCNCPKNKVGFSARYNANNQPEPKCV
ncbi:claudin-4-like [Protopterus annectens]|uniref:claudin-4-like n=1 Tax=Protopterus annectens TaxID=7888 RepID=UPI001CFBBFB1|nr:claudin-4-like [Protopterus annectens]